MEAVLEAPKRKTETKRWMYHELGVLSPKEVFESEVAEMEANGWTKSVVPAADGIDAIYAKIDYHKKELAKYEAEIDRINGEIDKRAARRVEIKPAVKSKEIRRKELDLTARTELNEIATKTGIVKPAELPNRQAVVEAIMGAEFKVA